MNKSPVYFPILLAGLLAAAGVCAQSAPTAGTSDLPTGEASTQTKGVPNAKTTNSPAGEAPMANKDASKDTKNMGAGAAAASSTEPKGEASTYVQGKPNVDPNMPAANKDAKAQSIMGAAPATSSAAADTSSPAAKKTRAEVVAELMGRRAAFDAERRAMRNQDTRHMMPRS
jgi:hypothetical protein